MAVSKNILEVRNLNKSYGAFALRDVSFEIPGGCIMGFIGPNGAGKTTTIKAVLGITRFSSGSVKLFGGDAGARSARPCDAGGADTQNERLGIAMDAPFYADEWTMNDVESALSPFYRNWNGRAYDDGLRRFGIERGKKVKELSRGMKVKAQLAAALCHDAELLVLDEPTSGLDPVARDEICELLREFVADENRGILFSTHITTDLEKIADYVTFILEGRVVFTGAKDELLEKYARVAGGPGEIDDAQRKRIIGCREHGAGFEGLIETARMRELPDGLLIEPATLEEIVIFMNRGATIDE
jgi:ABC-2 type transport system ATP-binding protein